MNKLTELITEEQRRFEELFEEYTRDGGGFSYKELVTYLEASNRRIAEGVREAVKVKHECNEHDRAAIAGRWLPREWNEACDEQEKLWAQFNA